MFIVFDLDDTLSDTSHRQHILEQEFETESQKWNAFFDACDRDLPKMDILQVLNDLVEAGHRIEIWTGRSSRVREKTKRWLHRYVFDTDKVVLRMRQDGDHRHDTEVKAEWITRFGKPDLVFDDRNSVVKWWREQGITCCQVKESTF